MPREIDRMIALLTQLTDEYSTMIRESIDDLLREHGFPAMVGMLRELAEDVEKKMEANLPGQYSVVAALALKGYCDTLISMNDQGAFADLP